MRTLRVYDDKGDFTIQVPDDSKVTFGYFNPSRDPDGGAFGNNRSMNVSRQTALRVYGGKTEKSNQIACFLGVKGFRDEEIGLTRIKERVIVETFFEDDGDGNEQHRGNRRRELVAAPEPDTYQ